MQWDSITDQKPWPDFTHPFYPYVLRPLLKISEFLRWDYPGQYWPRPMPPFRVAMLKCVKEWEWVSAPWSTFNIWCKRNEGLLENSRPFGDYTITACFGRVPAKMAFTQPTKATHFNVSTWLKQKMLQLEISNHVVALMLENSKINSFQVKLLPGLTGY